MMSLANVQSDVAARWAELLVSRFKIEVVSERQPAFHSAMGAYAESLNQSIEGLYELANRRQLTNDNWQHIVHLATNHETRFFRNPAVIKCVAELAGTFTRPRVLSVGCSTGEEVYSLAMECARRELPSFHIHGTDISAPCIEIAQQGVYRNEVQLDDRFATQLSDGKTAIRSWLKGLVSFEEHNVLSSRQNSFYAPNIILTQHMLIYYRVSTRHKILDSLACQLQSGGYLVIAAAEEAGWKHDGFERLNNLPATVFRKS